MLVVGLVKVDLKGCLIFLFSFHQTFNVLSFDGNIFEEILVTGFGDPKIVFNPHAHLFFFNINAGFNGKHHASLDGFSFGAKIMHINAQVM